MKMIMYLDGDIDDIPSYLKEINIDKELIRKVSFEVET